MTRPDLVYNVGHAVRVWLESAHGREAPGYGFSTFVVWCLWGFWGSLGFGELLFPAEDHSSDWPMSMLGSVSGYFKR